MDREDLYLIGTSHELAVAALKRGSGQLVVLTPVEQLFFRAFARGVERGYIKRLPDLFVCAIGDFQDRHFINVFNFSGPRF